MAVSESDVLHVAALARLSIDPGRLASLVSELNGILEHMEVLGAVDTAGWRMGDGRWATTATPIRSDSEGNPVPLAAPREASAPEMRDGFFLVPRLETHEGEAERTP